LFPLVDTGTIYKIAAEFQPCIEPMLERLNELNKEAARNR
jgi:hypothetical protein